MKNASRKPMLYAVVVEQHGERDIETFSDFESLNGQFYNYGLTNCTVLGTLHVVDPTPEQFALLKASIAQGQAHWSHGFPSGGGQ